MKNSIKFSNLFKSPLFVAVAATFAVAGCSTQPTPRNSSFDYTGPTGAQGPSGPILHYDRRMAGDIAKYVNAHQTRRIGIDGSDPQRTEIVRQALLNAGIPAWKMEVGPFGDPQLRRYGRVAVLVSN